MERTDGTVSDPRRAAATGGPFRWDKAAIADALRRRHARGLELSAAAVQKSDSGLGKAAYHLFGSYDEALRAAGIDPASVRRRVAWDKPRIVEALRQRHARGEAMHLAAIQRSDPRLCWAIAGYFGSHADALRAAGIEPPVVERARFWSQARIVEALRARAAAGLEMNVMAIRKADSPLRQAMSRYFGSCEAALRAAGIDPAAVAKQRSWDAATVLARLRERLADGLPLNEKAIEASDNGLCQAVRKYFGSHDDALREIGLDPATVRRATSWDREKVVKALRDRAAKGLEVHSAAVAHSDVKLSGAIVGHFESHDDALRAAGIDPAAVRKKRPDWAEAEILCSLRALSRGDVLPWPLSKRENAGLEAATRRRFGSVEAAAAAAGLRYGRPPARGGIGHWTEQLVLQALRDLHRGGHDLRYRQMKQRSQPLFFAAKHFFGSYTNAVRQAGIDYTQMVRTQLARERAAARPDEEPYEADPGA